MSSEERVLKTGIAEALLRSPKLNIPEGLWLCAPGRVSETLQGNDLTVKKVVLSSPQNDRLLGIAITPSVEGEIAVCPSILSLTVQQYTNGEQSWYFTGVCLSENEESLISYFAYSQGGNLRRGDAITKSVLPSGLKSATREELTALGYKTQDQLPAEINSLATAQEIVDWYVQISEAGEIQPENAFPELKTRE